MYLLSGELLENLTAVGKTLLILFFKDNYIFILININTLVTGYYFGYRLLL